MNEKYPETGIIYMPMDYYYDWYNLYTISNPDIKTLVLILINIFNFIKNDGTI